MGESSASSETQTEKKKQKKHTHTVKASCLIESYQFDVQWREWSKPKITLKDKSSYFAKTGRPTQAVVKVVPN